MTLGVTVFPPVVMKQPQPGEYSLTLCCVCIACSNRTLRINPATFGVRINIFSQF